MVLAVERRSKGFDLHARPRDDPWGSKGGTSCKAELRCFSPTPFIFQGNILVDKTCHARIADFGLTILSDSMIPSLGTQGGTVRWMSPELLDSGAQDRQPTRYSDCYALGMVIYEVISLCMPFHRHQNSVIPGKVVQGDRPERPKGVDGVQFTNDMWEMLERCWAPKPGNRPRIEDVLRCLERGSMSWGPHSG